MLESVEVDPPRKGRAPTQIDLLQTRVLAGVRVGNKREGQWGVSVEEGAAGSESSSRTWCGHSASPPAGARLRARWGRGGRRRVTGEGDQIEQKSQAERASLEVRRQAGDVEETRAGCAEEGVAAVVDGGRAW